MSAALIKAAPSAGGIACGLFKFCKWRNFSLIPIRVRKHVKLLQSDHFHMTDITFHKTETQNHLERASCGHLV